jgi:hypothetical protein
MVLTEEHQMIRDALREFSQQQLVPHAAHLDDVSRMDSLKIVIPAKAGIQCLSLYTSDFNS